MNVKTVFIIAITLTLCSCGNNDHYNNADQFRDEILSWNVIGKNLEEALRVGALKGFSCKEEHCHKKLSGFPCNQSLGIDFQVNNRNTISSFKIWTIEGKLPTQCL